MPMITFTSPEYRDKTVYAVAGSHVETVLKIAKANKIPIAFNCQDGECGTCLVKVSSLEQGQRMCGRPLEREIGVLKNLGKVTNEEIDAIRNDDMPPPWRLACQLIVRDEDLLVEY